MTLTCTFKYPHLGCTLYEAAQKTREEELGYQLINYINSHIFRACGPKWTINTSQFPHRRVDSTQYFTFLTSDSKYDASKRKYGYETVFSLADESCVKSSCRDRDFEILNVQFGPQARNIYYVYVVDELFLAGFLESLILRIVQTHTHQHTLDLVHKALRNSI